MRIIGSIGAVGLSLLAIAFTASLFVSAWNALREEVAPGFRMDPPGPRSLVLTLCGVVLPILLLAALSTFLAISLLRILDFGV